MKLYIKYMVSLRCKLFVKDTLEKLNIRPVSIDLGMVEVYKDLTPEQLNELKIELLKSGLELL